MLPSQDIMLQVEADCYWCLCKLVEGIQVCAHRSYISMALLQMVSCNRKELPEDVDVMFQHAHSLSGAVSAGRQEVCRCPGMN
jgi:hypothetical protein